MRGVVSAVDAETVTQMTADECWRRLRAAPYGRLAVMVEGAPDIFPVNHVVDRGSLVFRTAQGTKLDGAVGEYVAYEVDGREEDTAWSVVVKGPAAEIRDFYESIEALDLGVKPWLAGSKPRFVRIEAEELSGRSFRVS